MKLFFAATVIAAGALLSSCGSTGRVGANSGGRPSVLRYAASSAQEDPATASHRQEYMQRYLERQLHMPVQIVQTTRYGSVIEAFRSHKIEAASIAPFSYILATQMLPIEAIVMVGSAAGEPGEYNGALVVPGNSPIHSVDDLIRHSKELTISFVDPASASGFLVENAFLQSKGLEPQRDFKQVVFSMSHPASVLTLKSGKVDVAACMLRIVKRYEDTGKLTKGDIRIIWTSPDIPNQPIAVRKDLPADLKESIQRALIDMPRNDPVAWANQVSKTIPRLPGQVYVAANDQMFDGLRAMARGAKNINLLEH